MWLVLLLITFLLIWSWIFFRVDFELADDNDDDIDVGGVDSNDSAKEAFVNVPIRQTDIFEPGCKCSSQCSTDDRIINPFVLPYSAQPCMYMYSRNVPDHAPLVA